MLTSDSVFTTIFVPLHQVYQLTDALLEELFAVADFGEVLIDVFTSNAGKFGAAMLVGEFGNADGVARIQLRLEKMAAAIYHLQT